MKLSAIILAIALAGGVAAQHFKIGEVNTQTPEGQMLQQIGQESDEAKKLALMEQFAAKYPGDKAAGWVWEQIQAAYLKAKQPDKAIEAGEKLIALDPADTEAAHHNLEAAAAKNDSDLIRKWAGQTWQMANKIVASPQPKDADEVEDWKKRVEWASQVKTYCDYALYAGFLSAPDPKKKIELFDALQAQNPQSQYLAQTAPVLFLAYRMAGENDKAVAVAEKMLATDQTNEEMLLVVADSYLQKKREPEKVHTYTAKVVELMSAKPVPPGVSEADWQNRKNALVGLAHYMSGKQYYTQNNLAAADKELRAALPLIQNNAQLKPEVLFYLGVANYKLEKIQEAANFNKECAALKSPYSATCTKNLTAIRAQYHGVK
jgi:tetratricopeptide (TPR) repeat protein